MSVVGLVCTWRILFDILHQFRAEEVSKGPAQLEGGHLEGGTGGLSLAWPELVGMVETVQSPSPSPRDYVPPTYPSPRDFVMPEYPSPAELLARMTEQQRELERPPSFTPAAPPSLAPLPSVAGAGPVIPTAPPLLQSGAAAETSPQMAAPGAAGGTVAALGGSARVFTSGCLPAHEQTVQQLMGELLGQIMSLLRAMYQQITILPERRQAGDSCRTHTGSSGGCASSGGCSGCSGGRGNPRPSSLGSGNACTTRSTASSNNISGSTAARDHAAILCTAECSFCLWSAARTLTWSATSKTAVSEFSLDTSRLCIHATPGVSGRQSNCGLCRQGTGIY